MDNRFFKVCVVALIFFSLNTYGQVSGTVFRDFNANGNADISEVGIAGLQVTAFDGSGNVLGPVTTADNGSYSIPGVLANTAYRIEFTIPASLDFLAAGPAGATSGNTTVSFINVPAGGAITGVDIAVNDPVEFCQTNPGMAVPCYIDGDPLGAGGTAGAEAMVTFGYDAQGNPFDGSPGAPPQAGVLATASQIGATWGIAYQRTTQRLFAAATVKRYAGLGPGESTGNIYTIDPSGVVAPVEFLDLNDIATIDTGSIGTNAARGLPADPGNFYMDASTIAPVATMGLGDIDISADDSTLWTINLNDRTLYSIVIDADDNPATAPIAADITGFPIMDPVCTLGEFRPFAVKVYRGDVYVGMVCDGSSDPNTNNNSNLEAIVQRFDGANFTEILRFPLDYVRGDTFNNGSAPPFACTRNQWFPWTNDEDLSDCLRNTVPFGGGNIAFDVHAYPQPVLADIEFDVDGSMILAFLDRMGSTIGNAQQEAIPIPPGFIDILGASFGSGDTLRVANVAGVFTLENNASAGGVTTAGAGNNQGPGGGEFYFQDFTGLTTTGLQLHQEGGFGGLALLPGQNEVAMTTMNTFTSVALTPLLANSGGINWFNSLDGTARDLGFLVYPQNGLVPGELNNFSKANGLGDIELMCNAAPIQIGNYIWMDTNDNGIQDPDEAAIAGVIVHLLDSTGAIIATAATNAAGNYLFIGGTATDPDTTDSVGIVNGPLAFGEDFFVVVDPVNFNAGNPLENATPATPLADLAGFANDIIRDSDGVTVTPAAGPFSGGATGVSLTTGNAGDNDHTFDFGFVFAAANIDLGDAPDSYSTLIGSGGPTHELGVGASLFLGACIDSEDDGQPNPLANGDDLGAGNTTNGTCAVANDDEDGVVFNDMIIACGTSDITVTSTQAGLLNAWIDFNGDGDFDAGDQIASDSAVAAGANTLTANIPCDAVAQAVSYARFRVSTAGGDGPGGTAADGEIEDYSVTIKGLDLGDAPDSYSTLIANTGAQHIVDPAAPLFLGACVDNEADGQPNPAATGDDTGTGLGTVGTCAVANDDEDGVAFNSMIVACGNADMTVTAGQSGLLNAWIDFNGDGDFDAADQIFTDMALAAGANALTAAIPCDAIPQTLSYARFRFDAAGGIGATGLAMTGEVEDYAVVIKGIDLGDAPDTYGTSLGAAGANHTVDAAIPLFLGACVDTEANGQLSAGADGDDLGVGNSTLGTCVANDDEDGVIFDSMIIACGNADTTVTVSQSGILDAWVDFNGDGDFDAGDQIFAAQAVAAGANSLSFAVPCSAIPQTTSYARFRLSTAGVAGPLGAAADGEIEDYAVAIKGIDLGDAPETFSTTIGVGGAQHAIDSTIPLFLGACVDTESDGQPSVDADGDDLGIGNSTLGTCAVANDDEDGVIFTEMIIACNTADISVNASQTGILNAWIDFNGDGDFDDTDQIANNLAVAAGVNTVTANVPCDAVPQANSYARFRVSEAGGDGPAGAAMTGEVEDYSVVVKGLDLGDAPDTYLTTMASAGAQHVVDPSVLLFMGACVDTEADGQPTVDADGDDLGVGLGTVGNCAVANDDEDGVTFTDMIVACNTADISINVNQPGLLNAWIDFDGDGDFDPGDQIATDFAAAAGSNTLTVDVPCDAVPQDTSYARFRLSAAGGDGPGGVAMTGEVEDYTINVKGIDLGDAPDSFATTIAAGGAQHAVDPAIPLFFGSCVDTEADGQPSVDADGDDLGAGTSTSGNCATANDDEDGVVFIDMIFACGSADIEVEASQSGILNAWIDFNGDGDFDAADQIATDTAVTAGVNTINITVPCDAVPQTTSYARFRLSEAGGDGAAGLAMSGEVEDYAIAVKGIDLADAPDTFGTTVAAGGAQHVLDEAVPVFMGNCVDSEADGVPTVTADGDDLAVGSSALGTCVGADDEDGVSFTTPLVADSTNTGVLVDMPAGSGSQACLLNVWFDFDQSGVFGDGAGEQVVIDQLLAADSGQNALSIIIPPDVPEGDTFARFRCDTAGGVGPTGVAMDGEVEDYVIDIGGNADLLLLKESDVSGVEQGGVFSYQLTVINNGPGDAVNVVVTDDLPSQVSLISTTGCAEDPVAVPTCSLGDLANGESISYSIMVQVDGDAQGEIINTAVVDADTSDPVEADNTDDVTTIIFIAVPVLNMWGMLAMLAMFMLLAVVRLKSKKVG